MTVFAGAYGRCGSVAAGAVEIVAGMVAVTGFSGRVACCARGVENHRGMTSAAVQGRINSDLVMTVTGADRVALIVEAPGSAVVATGTTG